MNLRKTLLRGFGLLLVLAVAGVLVLHVHRPGLDRYRDYLYPTVAEYPGALRASWFGTTALLLNDGTSAVMIDPFFTRPEGWLNLALNREIAPDEALIADWLRRAGIGRLDAVMVSHSHYDHAMDAGIVALLTGAVLIGSESTLNIGRGAGLPEAQLRLAVPGTPQRHGAFEIEFVQSRHAGGTGGVPTGEIGAPLKTPARYLDYKLGGAYSILLRHAQGTVLHHGSPGVVPGALAGRRADVAFTGVALIEDLDVFLREIVDATGARRVIPLHWDDFTRGLDEPLRPQPLLSVNLEKYFNGMARRPDLQLQTLELAQPVVLFEQNSQ